MLLVSGYYQEVRDIENLSIVAPDFPVSVSVSRCFVVLTDISRFWDQPMITDGFDSLSEALGECNIGMT